MKKSFIAFALTILFNVSWAQTADSWLIQGGASHFHPNATSHSFPTPFIPGSTFSIADDAKVAIQVTYVYSEKLSFAVPVELGFQNKIYASGAINGAGEIGAVTTLPVSVFAQYRFGESHSKIRPYAMLGLSYLKFSDGQGSVTLDSLKLTNTMGSKTGLKMDSKFALSPGIGIYFQIVNDWFFDVSYAQIPLSTITSLSTGQRINTTFNSSMTSIGVGTRF